jgi:hypothetical protein
VVGERGYTILSDNGDGNGPAAILINDETLASARKLIAQLYESGWGGLAFDFSPQLQYTMCV